MTAARFKRGTKLLAEARRVYARGVRPDGIPPTVMKPLLLGVTVNLHANDADVIRSWARRLPTWEVGAFLTDVQPGRPTTGRIGWPLNLWLTPEEKQIIKRKAKAAKARSVAAYLLSLALAAP